MTARTTSLGGPGAEVRNRIEAGEEDADVRIRGGLYGGSGDDDLNGGPQRDYCDGMSGGDRVAFETC